MLRGYPEIKNKCLSGFRNLFDKIWHLNLVWGGKFRNVEKISEQGLHLEWKLEKVEMPSSLQLPSAVAWID